MSMFSAFNINATGMTAERYRMDVISENVANANTTRTADGTPYRRKVVVFQAGNGTTTQFRDVLAGVSSRYAYRSRWGVTDKAGVRVAEVAEDPSDFKLKYDPDDPDANEDGYVELPNVDLVKEVADAMAASQAYSADVTAFNLLKNVVSSALEIGR